MNISPFDYTREQVAAVRQEMMERFQHESAYRKQYGEMAGEAIMALSEKGWVSLGMSAVREDVADIKRGQNRIFATAFALLISVLTLLVTVIFGILVK